MIGIDVKIGRFLWGYNRGEVLLVEATPEEFHIKVRFRPIRFTIGTIWPGLAPSITCL